MRRYAYINGKILPHEKAAIRIDDIGLTRGFGIYEGIMTYGGHPFALALHYKRLSDAAKLLGLSIPLSLKELEKVIITLIRKSDFIHPVIRLLLTGGETVAGICFEKRASTCIVFLEELSVPSKEAYEKGGALITAEYARQFPEAKTINYIAAVTLQPKILKAKALEALYVSKGKVLESTVSNFFIVRKRVLLTAKNGVLPGITRHLVIMLARRAGYKVKERDISFRETLSADEAFLTSSFKEVVPISMIDGKKIGKGIPGPATKELKRLFTEYVADFVKKN